jgi:hypothetical protein
MARVGSKQFGLKPECSEDYLEAVGGWVVGEGDGWSRENVHPHHPLGPYGGGVKNVFSELHQ